MSFKYINPGYPRLGGADFDHQTGNINPVNNIYCYSDIVGSIDFPSDCNEIWAKADFYNRNNSWYGEIGVGNPVSSGTGRNSTYPFYGFFRNEYRPCYCIGGDAIILSQIPSLETGRQYSVLVHCKNGENGFLLIYLNGLLIYSYSGIVTWPAHKITWRNAKGNISVHNIIVSDEEISLSEQVYVVPAKTTETTMTESNGTYTASEVGQTLKQTVDTDALVAKVGSSDIKITGVGFHSSALFDGEGLTKLGFLNGDIEVSEESLRTTNYEYASSWCADMSLAELATIKVGCIAKE